MADKDKEIAECKEKLLTEEKLQKIFLKAKEEKDKNWKVLEEDI